ncbi:MAG: right-handed parallel beta-helix repeat-containing protein [Planctomycetota bacterium]
MSLRFIGFAHFFGFALSLILATNSVKGQTVIYVDDDHISDPAPGNPAISNPMEDGTIERPFDGIQEAIDFAEEGDLVLLQDGTYTGQENRNLTFRGKGITVRGEHGAAGCVVDCEQASRGFVFEQGEGLDSVLEGVTIRNGLLFSDGAFGAGIMILSSSPTIRECVVEDCIAAGLQTAGGGVYCDGSEAWLDHCVIRNNQVTGFFGRGGGVFLMASSPVISDCVISGNQSSGIGGGMHLDFESEPNVFRTRIHGNFALFLGGAASCQSLSHARFQSCVISENQSSGTAGISCDQSSPRIHNTLFVGNRSTQSTSGVLDCFSGANPVVTNCTVVNNEDSTGIGCFGGAPIMRSCVITGDGDDLLNCTARYSFIGDGDSGEGNVTGDPVFVGPDDFRLQSLSPCINVGDFAFVPGPGEPDLDGHSRVICGRVDMGAYEFGIGDHDCDRRLTLSDFTGWEECRTGPDFGEIGDGCEAFDFNADLDVDLIDFADYANLLTSEEP